MATGGKVPFLGFKAALKNLILLGFGASAGAGTAIADAYLTDFIEVPAVGRFTDVGPIGRVLEVPVVRRMVEVNR